MPSAAILQCARFIRNLCLWADGFTAEEQGGLNRALDDDGDGTISTEEMQKLFIIDAQNNSNDASNEKSVAPGANGKSVAYGDTSDLKIILSKLSDMDTKIESLASKIDELSAKNID